MLTPESSIAAQKDLGADIIIPFDELPPYHFSAKNLKESLERTHRWEVRSLEAHLSNPQNQAMYAVVHGGIDLELRKQSCDFLKARPFDGLQSVAAWARRVAKWERCSHPPCRIFPMKSRCTYSGSETWNRFNSAFPSASIPLIALTQLAPPDTDCCSPQTAASTSPKPKAQKTLARQCLAASAPPARASAWHTCTTSSKPARSPPSPSPPCTTSTSWFNS